MSTNSRKFTVKTVSGEKREINVCYEDSFEDFKSKILTEFNVDENKQVRLTFKGKILDSDLFSKLHTDSILGCIFTKKSSPNNTVPKVENSQDQTVSGSDSVNNTDLNTNVNTDVNTNNTNSSNSNNNDGPMYRFKNIKAYTVVFFNFIATNPQLRNAFLNDYGLLVKELIENKDLDMLMRNILDQSSDILKSMEKGENIKLNINMNSNSMEKLDDLTNEDSKIIDEIISMGFSPDKVVVEYLKSGKNLSKTLDALQK